MLTLKQILHHCGPINYWLHLTQILYILFLIILTIDHFLIRPLTPNITHIIFWIKILPILLFFPVLIKGYTAGLIGLCFMIMFYFISAVVGFCLPTRSFTQAISIGLTVCIFCFSMASIRYAKKIKN
ncbi:MAG: DUF2069 domain-containing protein [Endozoicomonadaceae bacterium]|nr:DUF2069 domain-containing protein [Endozoicomonadaceae bacterium]